MIEFRTHHELPVDAASAEWQLLLDEDPNATVFHGPRYLRAWHDVLGPRYALRVHTIHRDGRLVGIVADENERSGGPTGPVEHRRFLGGTEVTDYLGPVSRPEDRHDVADAYVANLARDVDWDEFIAGGLPVDSGWGDAFRRAANAHGLEILHEEIEDVCPRIDLGEGHDAYLARLPGRLRQELTRKTRKLARDAGELRLVEVAPDDLVGAMDDFLTQAVTSFPEKSAFFGRADIHEWFRTLGTRLGSDGTVRVHRLEVGGLLAATTVSLVGLHQWGLYNSAFDVTLGALAPGMVIIWLLIEEACREGLTTFDLLRGDEPYKYRFGAVDRPLERLVIGRR